MQARAVPRDAVRRRGLRARAPRLQPVERRRHREPLADRVGRDELPRHARLPEGRRGPRPAAGGACHRRHHRRRAPVEPLRAQRAGAGRPALLLQARLARGAHRVHARADHRRTPRCRSRSWATSTSRRSTTTTATPRSSWARRRTSRRPSAQAFFTLENAGVTDVVRARVPEGLYTYWDYKQLRFPRNEGMRIDFILGSAAFAAAVTDASIHRNERKGNAPSDHVPVLVDLALVEGRRRPADDLRLRHPGPLADREPRRPTRSRERAPLRRGDYPRAG